MKETTYVIAGVMAGTFVVTWVVGRIFERIHDPLAIASSLVQRVGVSVIFSMIAASAAMDGGYAWIAVPFLGLLALFGFAITAVVVWVWVTGRMDDETPGHSHSPSE